MFRAGFLRCSEARWTDVLSEMRHDFYHLPEYLEFSAAHAEPGEPLAFMAWEDSDRFFVPLIIRRIPLDCGGDGQLADATSPRGYPGPLLSAADPSPGGDFLDRAVQAFKDELRSRGVVSAYIRLHPLLTSSPDSFLRHGAVVDHGDSVAIDLHLSTEEMWRMTEHGHRQDINKAKRMGYVTRIDEDWERLDGLVQAYSQSMVRVGAPLHWRLSRDYFAGLRDTLGERMHLCVVEDGDRLCAAAMLAEVDGIVEYHLAGTMDDYVAMSPSKAIVDFARQWAKDRGNRVLHLAGSLRRGDALIRFKLGFSPLLHPVLSWRVVSDADAYTALSRIRSPRPRTVPDELEGFFPAYRKPLRRPDDDVA